MSRTVKLPDNREVNLEEIYGPEELRGYLNKLLRKAHTDSNTSFSLRIFAPKVVTKGRHQYAQYENGQQKSLLIAEVDSNAKKINLEHYDLIMTRGMTPEMIEVINEFTDKITLEIHDVSLQERKKSFLTQFAVEQEPVHGDIGQAILRVETDRTTREPATKTEKLISRAN